MEAIIILETRCGSWFVSNAPANPESQKWADLLSQSWAMQRNEEKCVLFEDRVTTKRQKSETRSSM